MSEVFDLTFNALPKPSLRGVPKEWLQIVSPLVLKPTLRKTSLPSYNKTFPEEAFEAITSVIMML